MAADRDANAAVADTDLDYDHVVDAQLAKMPAEQADAASPAKTEDAPAAKDTATDKGEKADGAKAARATARTSNKTEKTSSTAKAAANSSVLDDAAADEKPDADEAEDDQEVKADAADDTADAAADDVEDKEEAPEKTDAADWREAFAKRQIARIEKELRRTLLAKDFDKEFKRRSDAIRATLSRYKTADDYMDAGWAAQERIRSGELRAAKLPANATAREIAQWRKDNGVPDKPEAYDIPKVPGHQWTEADKPVLDSFKAIAHKSGLSQEAVNDVTTWYAQEMQSALTNHTEALQALDGEDRVYAEETLRAELGNAEWRPTIKLINDLFADPEHFPPGVGEKLKNARYPDGHLILNDPEMLKLFRNMALDYRGAAGMPTSDVATSRNSRKSEIEQIMRTDMDQYWRDGLDKELAEIIQAEEEMNNRPTRPSRR